MKRGIVHLVLRSRAVFQNGGALLNPLHFSNRIAGGLNNAGVGSHKGDLGSQMSTVVLKP
ncbi:hypothetical protein [Larkinella terrae]|uniref:hypothetical protein n=1 Tax=Larkinella terrae TaxID=2025311 RepID=UPI00197CFB96|nr:hypothetical protein [Larkinella terrae]